MSDPADTFEEWAIIDLFGHQRIAGKVTNQNIGSATFIRVDVYEDSNKVAFTRFFNPSAVYGISPVSKKVALAAAKAIDAKPVQAWDLPVPAAQRQLMATRSYDDE
jgi:hypothetical protein